MANNPYNNFVLEDIFESPLTTKVDMANYLTADYSLSENAGMKKTIHKYKATGSVEDLATIDKIGVNHRKSTIPSIGLPSSMPFQLTAV